MKAPTPLSRGASRGASLVRPLNGLVLPPSCRSENGLVLPPALVLLKGLVELP